MRAGGERHSALQRAALTPRAAGGRVTVGDVAARSGLQLSEASAALNALAADTGAALKVSEAGDLLYVYRPGARAALAAKSWRLRLAPAFAKARKRAWQRRNTGRACAGADVRARTPGARNGRVPAARRVREHALHLHSPGARLQRARGACWPPGDASSR